MGKLQELTDKICEVIPEIKELKFGCKVKFTGNTDNITMSGVLHYAHEWKGRYGVCIPNEANSFGYQEITKEQLVEIIGRDITLVDVLRVMDICDPYKDSELTQLIYSTEKDKFNIYQEDGDYYENSRYKELGFWNLSQNALHLQPEETIDFLHSIIVKASN